MRDNNLFQLALGLVHPWKVTNSTLNTEKKQLNIHIDFKRGGTFTCPHCKESDCKAYDTVQKQWRHLNFFEFEAYIHARIPRIDCPTCGIKLVNVPWARTGSGFTLLFEALIMTMVKEMPIAPLSRIVNEHDTLLWRVLHYYVNQGLQKVDMSKIEHIGVDETSRRKGHNYISVFVDMDTKKVVFATEGKDSKTVATFKENLELHNGCADNITEMCCDMSPAYIKGISETFPNCNITFDKFHTVKIINEAVDKVRRQEQYDCEALKGTRYLWLKNPVNLTQKQTQLFNDLQISNLHLKTARAYHLKLAFQDLYSLEQSLAEPYLKKWYYWATHSHLKPMQDAAKTIKKHWNGILRWFTSNITNGILEGTNSLIQAAKARAKGYSSTYNLIAMVYLITGNLKFDLPT